MQASELAATLHALQTGHRLQGEENPCAAVQALDATLASLQQLQAELKATQEYRAAQKEQRRLSESERVRQLTETVERSRAAAEAMLGYPLEPQHLAGANVYALMPSGYVDRLTFDANVRQLQMQLESFEDALDKVEGELAALKSPNFKPPTFGCNFNQAQALEHTKARLRSAELQVHAQRSRLLNYMATHQPMLDADFSATLAVHFDAMLAAYVALRAP